MDHLLELQDLTTGYTLRKGFKVISSHLTAQLRPGRLTCLLGPNGSGKTTLLRTLSAFLSPLSGQVIIDGSAVSSLTIQQRARAISLVLTDNRNITGMTTQGVVSMGRSPYTGFWGKLGEKDREIVQQSLTLVGAQELAARPIHTLSDGELQKVMIAKAIAQETPFIFLDEPTAFLDYPNKVKMMLLLHRLAHTLGRTIFLSTHDVEQALAIADDIWLLNQEEGLVTGTPQELSQARHINRYFDSDEITYNPESRQFSIHKNISTTL